MLEQITWRRETLLRVDGAELGVAAPHVTIATVEQDYGHRIVETITGLSVAGLSVPLSSRSRKLVELGGGRWRLGKSRIEVVQPEGDSSPRWP